MGTETLRPNGAGYPVDKTQYAVVAKADPLDRIQVELFDTKQVEAFPQAKMMRFDNEVNLSIRLIESVGGSTAVISSQEGIIKYTKNNYECQFKYVVANDLHPEGAIDFDILLIEEPANLELNFSIVGKGIEFLYQAPFDQLYKPGDDCDGWIVESVTPREVFGPKGQLITSRVSEDVVGSYAVYYRNCPANIRGRKQYKTGKVGHIYYPYLIDSEGKKHRAESFSIQYDEKSDTGTCKIGIPKGLQYPVLVDPTIGYTSMGASNNYPSAVMRGSLLNSGTDSNGGTVTKICFGGQRISANPIIQGSIYTATSTRSRLDPQTAIVTVNSSTNQWWELVFTNGPDLDANTDYIPFVASEGISNGLQWRYDSSEENSTQLRSGIFSGGTFDWPSTITSVGASTSRYSIYAVYESSSPPEEQSRGGLLSGLCGGIGRGIGRW